MVFVKEPYAVDMFISQCPRFYGSFNSSFVVKFCASIPPHQELCISLSFCYLTFSFTLFFCSLFVASYLTHAISMSCCGFLGFTCWNLFLFYFKLHCYSITLSPFLHALLSPFSADVVKSCIGRRPDVLFLYALVDWNHVLPIHCFCSSNNSINLQFIQTE